MLKVVFCGYGKLGKDCLNELIQNDYQVCFVMTHREGGIDSVDTLSLEKGIKFTYSDSRKRTRSVVEVIKEINPDYLISVNYRYIIPREIFTLARYAINIHGALLPKYRGRTPHVWSIINGEKQAGITCHLIEEQVDKGDIVLQERISIEEEDTGFTLLKKYEKAYPRLLIDALKQLLLNRAFEKQNESEATFFGKRTPDMGYIYFSMLGEDVINFVRAQAEPYPGAYAFLPNGDKIIINKVKIVSYTQGLPIGRITCEDNGYFVQCKDSLLELIDYRVEIHMEV